MSGKMLDKSRWLLVGLLGMIAVVFLAVWGCGTKGYDVPASPNPVTTTGAPAIIGASTLKQWVDQGKLNASSTSANCNDRVVVVSIATLKNYTTASKKHIPGAVLMDTSSDLTDVREEGLGPVSNMMLSGPHMDSVVQKLGIDGKTTIVLTAPKGSTDSEYYQLSVAYFTFRYWGFARERLKILNGGDDAWDVAGQPLTKTAPVISASTYSVKSNSALKDVVRYSVTEMLALVDAINKDTTLLNTWQMLDARGYTTAPYLTNTLRTKAPTGTAHAMMFLEDRVNGDATRNRLYPDKATLISRMSTYPVDNASAVAYLSPTKKTVVMCGSSTSASPSFVLFDAVLGVPEGDIMMYDGSSSQWTLYSKANITTYNTGISATQRDLWAFDAVTPGTSIPRIQGGTLTATTALKTGNAFYSPTQIEMNQIESADRSYMVPTSTSGGTTTPSGGTTGGNTGGGC